MFVNIDFATEINLKLSYLPQISDDILDSIKTDLATTQVILRTKTGISDIYSETKPYFTREQVRSLLESDSILKEFDNLETLIKSSFSAVSTQETYISVDLKINKISNPESIVKLDKFAKVMGAYGKIVVPCVILLNLQHPQSAGEILATLKTQLHYELKYKIAQSMIKYSHNRKGLLILPPESHLLHYKDVILNLKIHTKKVDIVKKQFELELVENLLFLSYFSQTHLPDIEKAFFAEEDKLILYRQKFSTLARILDKQLGIGLIRGLAYIYKERGQIDSVTEVQRLASGL
jgi:hypothetical protein